MMRGVTMAEETLGADERGVVLGLVLGAAPLEAAERLAGPGAARCRAAVAAWAAAPEAERAASRAALVGELAADVPRGLELVHPGWVRRALEGEPTAVIRAVVAGLPDDVRRVGDEIVRARGDGGRGPTLTGPGVARIRRALFAGLAPLPPGGEAAPSSARALCALAFAALVEELDRRGAEALGLALSGAPDAVVARAAAGVGEPLARVVLAAARAGATAEARAAARALVAAVPSAEAARGPARAVGLRAVASALAGEGGAALAAVAQRLPPALGDALLAAAPVGSA
jgi:hypothetical protein